MKRTSTPFHRLLLVFALALCSASLHIQAADKPNVPFIAIDDLNHWVGHLGRNPQTKTPNIDRLAKMGVTFTKAYCTAPACNPSRASLMSGLRPNTTGCYLNSQNWRPGISEDKLPIRISSAPVTVSLAREKSITARRIAAVIGRIIIPAARGGGAALKLHPSAKDDGVGGIKFGALANTDEEMPDYSTVSYCIEKMAAKSDQPFFIACGLVKPHMPFSVPKKWFDMFPLDSIQLPPHRADDLDDVPPAGVKMAKPQGDHADIVKSGRWKEAVQAYLATIAFCDAQVGRLLDAWEKSPQRENTIICLWSDHGWSLGEKSHWRKFALWEEPTRTVFIWKAPGVTSTGGVCDRPVDYTSIYPTLCALTGLRQPAHLEGRDISPLLKDVKTAWDVPAITMHGFRNHTVRTEDWRYIRYADGGEELYHNAKDPLEYTNLAGHSEHQAKKTELANWLPKTNAPELPGGGAGEGDDAKKAKRKAKKAQQ